MEERRADQETYDDEREMRRRAKLQDQHERYERAYQECRKQVCNEPWFRSMSVERQERHLSLMAADKYLMDDCARR